MFTRSRIFSGLSLFSSLLFFAACGEDDSSDNPFGNGSSGIGTPVGGDGGETAVPVARLGMRAEARVRKPVATRMVVTPDPEIPVVVRGVVRPGPKEETPAGKQVEGRPAAKMEIPVAAKRVVMPEVATRVMKTPVSWKIPKASVKVLADGGPTTSTTSVAAWEKILRPPSPVPPDSWKVRRAVTPRSATPDAATTRAMPGTAPGITRTSTI